MSARRWRVLIADDDPTVGLLARAALSGSAFLPTVVDTGSAALQALLADDFDIALLDVEMPEMDGVAVCRAVRAVRGRLFPMVLVTGRGDPAFVADAQGLGVEMLGKPLNWGGLAAYLQCRIRAAAKGMA